MTPIIYALERMLPARLYMRSAPARRLLPGLMVLGWAILAGACHQEEPPGFNAEVRPLLNDRCLACHGGVKASGGFSLLFEAEALDTTDAGRRALVPGHPGRSEMIRRVAHSDPDERMPPEGPPLTGEEVELLRRWVAAGAAWEAPWAFVPPERPAVPAVDSAAWVRRGLDAFVLARLEAEGVAPSAEASCAVLVRRVSLDLVGLPPKAGAVAAVCEAFSEASYEAYVDRLLASPRFGERWAGVWLDLARYADSRGYQKDNHRDMWRYRDWLIGAFNGDVPFDRFTVEQLAGDLLPGATDEQLLATAFHRNTMTNDEGGTDDEEFRVAAVIDRVNTTMEVWQGVTMACVQCHAHPYDPIRHEEYYGLYAFFNTTEDADRPDDAPTLTAFSQQQRAELDRLAADPSAPLGAASASELQAFLAGLDAGERSADEARQLRSFDVLRDRGLHPSSTPIMRELPADSQRTTYLFERGNWLVHGDAVEPGVPASLGRLPEEAPRNRLGLAQWLVSPENPLTARVTVNRFWAHLFGVGLVRTVEDFGTQGEPPSHPDLLDHLAVEFQTTHGWSVKALLRDIVLSATYRQSSAASPEAYARDPENRMLARGPRVRLSAEQVRDQALAVAGLLSDKMYGPSVMPPQPPGVWNVIRHVMRWETSPGEDRYRRALYTYWRRSAPYPSLVTFDAPSREMCVSRRVQTNTPLQALVTLNDPVYAEAAHAFGERMRAEAGPSLDDRLTFGYRAAVLRPPSSKALDALRDHFERTRSYYEAHPDSLAASEGAASPEEAAYMQVASVLLNLDGFLTKE